MSEAAVIIERVIRGCGREFVANIYDKNRPRNLASPDTRDHYFCIDMLGPFKTKADAVRACAKRGVE